MFDLQHPARGVYLLCSGYVQLARGREAIVDYLSPGSFFGEECLLEPEHQHQIATCLSPVQVFAFRKSSLLDLLQNDRRFAARVLRDFALRINRYEENIRDFVAERAERRLALLLLRLVPTRANSGWVRLPFSPTNADLAKAIGTTRWRVAHFMREFQRRDWLDRRPELWVRPEIFRTFLESPPARQ